MLSLLIRILHTYLPIGLGISYVLGFERKKMDNLLKFFVISTCFSLLLSIIESSFETWLPNLIAVPVYIYLTLFNYMYAGITFDVFFAPLFNILLEGFLEMKKKVERERARVKLERENGNKQAVSQEGRVQGVLVDIFQPDNIYLLR